MTFSLIRVKYLLPFLFIAGLLGFYISGAYQILSFQTLAAHYGMLKTFVVQHYGLASIIFCLVYIISVTFSLPVALVLTLAGGALLGWAATVMIVVSATIGATILFIGARSVVSHTLRKRIGGLFDKFEKGFNEDSFTYLLALRLIPVAPFWVVNIAPAFVGMKLGPFILATGLGIIPGTFIYVSIARGFDSILARGEVPDLSILGDIKIAGPLIALGVLALLPPIWRYRNNNSRGHHE